MRRAGPSGALAGETQRDATKPVGTRERSHVVHRPHHSERWHADKAKSKKKVCVGRAVGTYWSRWEGKSGATGGTVVGTRCVTNWWSKDEGSTITGTEPGMPVEQE